ncbi:hypothetical protein [Luteimonas saliphila]|uniref:hypothetical protein n=1 Tax=Luteimonas saliphila TaxID=2804919 RepID=UPI00192DD7D3|nr:hypothetical protein [Luteimonas saliphila]
MIISRALRQARARAGTCPALPTFANSCRRSARISLLHAKRCIATRTPTPPITWRGRSKARDSMPWPWQTLSEGDRPMAERNNAPADRGASAELGGDLQRNHTGRISPVLEVQLLRAAACDWRLCRGDVAVLAVILEHCNEVGEAFPGPALIAKRARLATTNVKARLRNLERLDYITILRPGPRKANRYVVMASPRVPTPDEREARAQLGMPAYLALGMRACPESAINSDPTRYAGVPSTRYAGVQQLGTPARQEFAFEYTSPEFAASQQGKRARNNEQEHTAREREIYDRAHARRMQELKAALEKS